MKFPYVFVKVFKQNNTFTNSEHEKAWIIRVTINECKDFMRSFWKKRFCCTSAVTLAIENTENREVVSLVLELPEKYRSVVYLYYFENYSTAEIAKLLDRKETTVRTQMKRARELLKRKMIGGFDNE
ncbi:sigma-70 family RNA polymerase sigma factor [Inconstantimicrobium mannanitabidum]|uniref:Uncharacterized protein n=1 Tax=Inconstantimicrobium mannanitabidum TaxID=1604901 RepID=A0ACB5RBE5_9CLOT|nr:sigma-70 family RNA polymerase sigma factor [Clostridium sp. TW13]GKX66445.1 hypothetical protein rsdtw13_17030 [Clostridium sp. TW13]